MITGWDVAGVIVTAATGLFDFYTEEAKNTEGAFRGGFCDEMAYSRFGLASKLTHYHIDDHERDVRELATFSRGRQQGILRKHLRVIKALKRYRKEVGR